MHTDIEEPVAFDRTPLTAAVAGAVGPRTPFSPERTFVTLPRENPEIEPLAGASERQGATLLLVNDTVFARAKQRCNNQPECRPASPLHLARRCLCILVTSQCTLMDQNAL